jgi:hypothetical protein
MKKILERDNSDKYFKVGINLTKLILFILDSSVSSKLFFLEVGKVRIIDILYTLDSASLLVKLKARIFQRLPPFE